MTTLIARTAAPTSVSAKRLLKLERTGRFEEALALFGEGWERSDFRIETGHLTAAGAAELKLRFGSLIGFQGYRERIGGSQDRSKDILTVALEEFVSLGDEEKAAECCDHIALAYWRKGEHVEAQTWIAEAMSHDLAEGSAARLYPRLIESLVLQSDNKNKENIRLCRRVEGDFRKFGDAFLNGSLSTNLGISFRNLRQNAEAMRCFTLARHFFEKAGHKPYLGLVQNNLALLHNADGRFESAHDAADSAIKLYKQVKDKTREASTLDSKAQILFTQKRFPEALKLIERSIGMLRKSEGSAYLAESLFTKARILLASDDLPAALLSLAEALDITRVQNSEAAAHDLAVKFAKAVGERADPKTDTVAFDSGEMELVLPGEIANYSGYRGLWINTPHLERAGLPSGSLAVIVPQEATRGDLVAVSVKETDAVSCGYYDSDFGIICLDRGDNEPLLFDADEVEVLGKIVGVSSGIADSTGKATVKAL